MPKALNFGSLNLDYVYQVDHFVQPGETLSAQSQSVHDGGKGLNQSIALARAGAEVYHAGCVGAGGSRLTQALRDSGVDTSFLRQVEDVQGNAVIQVNPEGENSILLYGGSNLRITEEQVTETLDAFAEGDYLLLQNEINGNPLIVEKAAERGMVIMMNPSPYNSRMDAVDFSRLNWLLVNEIEAKQIAGSADPEEAWKTIHGKYPALSLVITRGSEGSTAFRTDGVNVRTAEQRAFPVIPADTTGAGDTYTGFFVGALMEGLPLQECMRRASMAAAISVTRKGAARSIPCKEELDGFCF